MSDENFSYAPPGADIAPNAPAPQPWQQRRERMATVKKALEFNPGNRTENPLVSQYDQELRQVADVLAPQFESLFNNQNWARDVANGTHRFGVKIDGLAEAGDIEVIAQKIATGVQKLQAIPEIAQKFADSPNWSKNIFRELLNGSIVAQSAASRADLLDDRKVTDVILSTQETYLKEWYGVAKQPLSIDTLTPEETHALAYGIQAVEFLNATRLSWLGPDSSLRSQIGQNNQGQLVSIISEGGPLFVPTMINAPHELVKLHGAITKSPHIRSGYQAPVAEAPAQTVTPGESDGTAEARDGGETPLTQQAEEAMALADRAVGEIEAKISAAQAALEALESEKIEAIQRLESAKSTHADAWNLELLKAEVAKREAFLKGFDEDPETRENQILAAKLLRPEDEGPGFATLEDFMQHVASLSVEQIATIYEIEPSQFEGNYNKFQTLMETVKNGIDFSMLRDPLITLFDRIIEDIGDENLQRGRGNLERTVQAPEGTDDLENRVRDGLAHLKGLLG